MLHQKNSNEIDGASSEVSETQQTQNSDFSSQVKGSIAEPGIDSNVRWNVEQLSKWFSTLRERLIELTEEGKSMDRVSSKYFGDENPLEIEEGKKMKLVLLY